MNLNFIKKALPWQIKIASKVIMSRFSISYRVWQRLNLFKHGAMEKPEYAYEVFQSHFDRFPCKGSSDGFVCMEIGPGDSLFSCMIANVHGALRTYLIDAGRFARQDIRPYREMAAYLMSKGFRQVSVDDCNSLDDILDKFKGSYGTEGVLSLKTIPTESVDFIWSQAVLEHIRRDEFVPFMKELRRIIKPDGVCSHRVDLKDHLGGKLNNLRFSKAAWESEWMSGSGFYTNRIRFNEMCGLFEQAGFVAEKIKVIRWKSMPTPRNVLAEPFRSLPEEDLLVSGFDVLLRPK
jgi:SAM-dependent methyltransferase